MTTEQLTAWLRANFAHSKNKDRINRAAFLEHAAAVGHSITTGQLNNWQHGRKIPAWLPDVLAKIEAVLDRSEPIAATYTVHLPLTETEVTALKRTAKKAQCTPEALLGIALRAAFEDECGIDD